MTSWGDMTHLAGVRPECPPDLGDAGAQSLLGRVRAMLGFSNASACGHPDCVACNS